MGDRPDDRAQRIEKKLETGDMQGAMNSLNAEMAQVTDPQERRAVLEALKQQNQQANDKDWTLPNVELTQPSEWWSLGLVKKEGEMEVKFTQNVAEQAGQALSDLNHKANPFQIVADNLDKTNKK